MSMAKNSDSVMGFLCGLAWVIIWSLGFLSLEQGLTTQFNGSDQLAAGLMMAGLISFPWLLRRDRVVNWFHVLILGLLGAILPMLLIMSGLQEASFYDVGIMVPVMLPVVTLFLAWSVMNRILDLQYLLGYVVMMLGVVVMGIPHLISLPVESSFSYVMFLGAALSWAAFGVLGYIWQASARRVTALAIWGGLILYLPYYFITQQSMAVLMQGLWWEEGVLLAGMSLGGIFFYIKAGRSLLKSQVAALAVLIPIGLFLRNVIFYQEPVGMVSVIGLVLAVAGLVYVMGPVFRGDTQDLPDPLGANIDMRT